MTRGDLVESVHAVDVVILDPDGTTRLAAGAVDAPMLPRSALKPAQAVAVLDAGADLTDAEVALAAGSHSGEDVHLAAVTALLDRHGLDESALACPPDRPLGVAADRAWGTAAPRALAMNCSGKHAAMLAACRARSEWALAGYTDPDHPLQALVAAVVDRLAGPVVSVTVDGCGAPALALSLRDLARLGHRLAATLPGGTPHRVAAAMRAHPHLVAGTDRFDTAAMTLLPGSLAKTGAEGVQLVVAPGGHAVAIKVRDGSGRASGPASLAALRCVDQDIPEELAGLAAPLVRGGRRRVGDHRVRT